jgi:two-component system LytT family sensor kinase
LVAENFHFVSTFLQLRVLLENPAYFSGMKRSWYSNKWVIIIVHIVAWIFLFSLPFILRPSDDNNRRPAPHQLSQAHFYVEYILHNLMLVGFFYFNASFLIPRFIALKKYWQFAVAQLLCCAALITLAGIVFVWIRGNEYFNFRGNILFNFFTFLFVLSCSTAYQLIREKIISDQLASERENENLKTELSLLRSQVSPHFMFNVLNNMVALARKQSDQLEPSLIKLSSLMRYMLYEADEDKVPLEKEIEYLQSYIDLQQQRFGKKVKVNVTVDAPDGMLEIEPMLLIPFVENAFKHGTGLIEDAQIDIDLRAKNNVLQFLVRNKYNEGSSEVKDKTSGIGLTNVKRRLNLLYGGNHSLLITKKDDWFVISLQLNLH